MAGRRQAFQNNPELQRFVLHGVRPTGRQLGVGSYGSVEELEVNGLVCAGKRLHEALLEQGNAGVAAISRKYLLECQVTSRTAVGTWDSASANDLFFEKIRYTFFFDATPGNGRDAAPTHCAVPGAVFPGRVSTASTGDGATGQQPGRSVGNFSWSSPCPQAIAADRCGTGSPLPAHLQPSCCTPRPVSPERTPYIIPGSQDQ